MKRWPLHTSLLFLLVTAPFAWAKDPGEGFKLVDEVCLAIEGEPPVLRSQIRSRALQKGIDWKHAARELERERRMWVYAKKQLKYNVGDIFRQTDEHIKKVRENNKLTEEQFAKVLMAPPYHTTLSQYRLDTATAILENLIRSSIMAQVTISDAEIREAVENEKRVRLADYDVVFIMVLPTLSKGNKLTPQFQSANEIRSHITPQTSFNELEKLIDGKKHIKIIGPINKDSLKTEYLQKLQAMNAKIISAPFEDDGAVTMIWKSKVPSLEEKDENALLEKIQKKLYEAAVEKKFNAITSAVVTGEDAIVKGCQER